MTQTLLQNSSSRPSSLFLPPIQKILFCALTSNHRLFRTVSTLVAAAITAGFLIVLIAVCFQPLPPELVGYLDAMLSLLPTSTESPSASAWEPIRTIEVPEALPEDFPPLGPSRTERQKNKSSPYPRGKDSYQIEGSRPSDVEHTAHNVTDRRYLIFVLSIIRH